jgi:dipeptidyl aminopeptidase/acylaminoacyl peptidase
LLGGTVQDKRELATQASPVTSVTANDPPFLIMHGDRDNMVPLQQSAELETALMKAGVKAQFFVVHGGKHFFFSPKTLQMVTDFFDATLKKQQ